MNKQDIINYFDGHAGSWDAEMIRNEAAITKILDMAGIVPGVHILDVACGTGVLFPDYLRREAASVTGIDISPEMTKIARRKFPQVEVICADVEEAAFARTFDRVMVYNAFPHFPNPDRLIAALAAHTAPGGRLTVAHGMSRAALDKHHSGSANQISIRLLEEHALAALFAPYFEVDHVISNEEMYLVSGVKKN